jgi:hypothetical protein
METMMYGYQCPDCGLWPETEYGHERECPGPTVEKRLAAFWAGLREHLNRKTV